MVGAKRFGGQIIGPACWLSLLAAGFGLFSALFYYKTPQEVGPGIMLMLRGWWAFLILQTTIIFIVEKRGKALGWLELAIWAGAIMSSHRVFTNLDKPEQYSWRIGTVLAFVSILMLIKFWEVNLRRGHQGPPGKDASARGPRLPLGAAAFFVSSITCAHLLVYFVQFR